MKAKNIILLKSIILCGLGLLCASCKSTQLYNWHNYQDNYYSYVKNADDKSLFALIKTYERILNKQDKVRGVVPPGIYADYGWLLANSGKLSEAKEMFAKELELYPESEIFVKSLLKRLEK